MSPADRPDPSPEPLPDDPDGSAPGPPEPEDLDVLVDRLAAEQARQSEAAPEQGPGSALLAEEMTTLLSILDGQREAVARKRSEEHTSELQSRGHLVCRLLLDK